jgi:hypothetical protein
MDILYLKLNTKIHTPSNCTPYVLHFHSTFFFLFDRPKKILRSVKIKCLLIVETSPALCYFVLLKAKNKNLTGIILNILIVTLAMQ